MTVLPTSYRGRRGLTIERQPARYMHPESFVNKPVPDGVVYDTAAEAAAIPALANAAVRAKYGLPRFGAGAWTPINQVVEADQPRVPVKLWQPGWTSVPPYFKLQADLMAWGVPVDLDDFYARHAANYAAGDRDLSLVVVSPDYVTIDGRQRSKEWDLWRAYPNTGPDAAQFPITCYVGTVALDLEAAWGYPTQKLWKGYTYQTPIPPTDTIRDNAEPEHSGISASKCLLGPLAITVEDLLGVLCGQDIDHSIGLAFPKHMLDWKHRWPSWAHDSVGLTAGAPFANGMRLVVPPDFDVDAWAPGPLERAITRCAQRHPLFISDGSTIVGGSFEQGSEPYVEALGGSYTRGRKGEYLLANMLPWEHVRILADGCSWSTPYIVA